MWLPANWHPPLRITVCGATWGAETAVAPPPGKGVLIRVAWGLGRQAGAGDEAGSRGVRQGVKSEAGAGGSGMGTDALGVVCPKEAPVSLSVFSYPAEKLRRDVNAMPVRGDAPETPTLCTQKSLHRRLSI